MQSIFHVFLSKKYIIDHTLIMLLKNVDMMESLSYEEVSIETLDHQIRMLRNKEVTLVKVLEQN